MKYFHSILSNRPVLGLLLGAGLVLAQTSVSWSQKAISPAEEDFEVLTRGPVHEAFADAVSYEAEPGLIVNVAPPEPIEELPPAQQLEGENVEWIPGYWAWDEDENDFLWLSGIWRNLPPDRQWVPGYWSDLQDGRWQWTAGYWADAELKEVAYIVAEPPRSVEAGPNIPAPSDHHVWTPGVWSWQDTRYAWSPGSWSPLREDWTWVPAHYRWTPRGYVFVDGYWDYAVDRRGVLFAPVRFNRHRPSYHAGYRYTPDVVVALEVFLEHLFFRPRSCHYYFGDYYDSRYRDRGYYSSFRWHDSRRGYDPIYCYQRWDHRQDRDWDRRHRERYDYYERNIDYRPPHTWAAMKKLSGKKGKIDGKRDYALALTDYAASGAISKKFRPLGKDQRDQILVKEKALRKVSKERGRLERKPKEFKVTDQEKKAVERQPLTASSIKGPRGNKFDKGEGQGGPPPRPAGQTKELRPSKAGSPAAIVRGSGQKPDKSPGRPDVKPASKKDAAPGRGPKPSSAPKKEAAPGRDPKESPGSIKESRPTPKKESRPAPKQESRPAPKKESRPAPKQESRPTPKKESRLAPKQESRPTPKQTSRPAPRKESRPAPKQESRPTPKQESRPTPKQTSRPAPRKESRPAPRKETRPAASESSRSSPSKEKRDKGGGGKGKRK